MTLSCPGCGADAEVAVLRHFGLCYPCAFELQCRVIDEAVADNIIAFDHNDEQGRAVYRSLICRTSNG